MEPSKTVWRSGRLEKIELIEMNSWDRDDKKQQQSDNNKERLEQTGTAKTRMH